MRDSRCWRDKLTQVSERVRYFTRTALDLIFPSRCVHCRSDGALLCERCLRSAPRTAGDVCNFCALPVGPGGSLCAVCAAVRPPLDRLISVFRYEEQIRSAVHALKYDGLTAIAPTLGEQMGNQPALGRMKVDAIVPVPMHPTRHRSRGYNQSELLARRIEKAVGAPLLPALLRRRKNTLPQARAADEKARIWNVRDAFEAAEGCKGRRVLLVDDVATTCSTLHACARALKLGGAAWVGAIVLAREL